MNKARTNSGLYLYTYDFNAKHTTGTTEPGINVVCTVEQGKLAIGSTVTLRVNRVEETAVTSLAPDQIVLSANLQADSYYTTALQNIPQGSELTLTVSANDGWEDVEYAIGALYCLAENGAVVAFGTDYPIVDMNPADTLYSAVKRRMENNLPEEGWNPREKFSMAEAIQNSTIGPAYMMHMEDKLGTLEEGKLADINVFNMNIFENEDELPSAGTDMTVFNGEIVYNKISD